MFKKNRFRLGYEQFFFVLEDGELKYYESKRARDFVYVGVSQDTLSGVRANAIVVDRCLCVECCVLPQFLIWPEQARRGNRVQTVWGHMTVMV